MSTAGGAPGRGDAGRVQRAAASGVDPAVAARLLFGMVNSLIEWYRPRGAAAAEHLADTVVTVAFDGLRVRRPGVPPGAGTAPA